MPQIPRHRPETHILESTLGVTQIPQRPDPGAALRARPDPGRHRGLRGAEHGDESRFSFRQPLLRGRGRAAVQAEELSAEHEVAASGLDLRFTVVPAVQVVAAQYWQVRAAEHNLDVLRASETERRGSCWRTPAS